MKRSRWRVNVTDICSRFSDVYDRETLVVEKLLIQIKNSIHIVDTGSKTHFALLIPLQGFTLTCAIEDLIYFISEMFELRRC